MVPPVPDAQTKPSTFPSVWSQISGPVVVGKNSLIGANAVVTKDVAEKSIMVGIPAKRVGDADKGFKPYAVTDKEE